MSYSKTLHNHVNMQSVTIKLLITHFYSKLLIKLELFARFV